MRYQFSLRTIFLLMLLIGAVIVMIVIPWRHRVRQEEIWTRLSSKSDLANFPIMGYEEGSYCIGNLSDKKMVRFLVENMEDCERITELGFANDSVSDEHLQKFSRLKNLRGIYLTACPLTQKRMNILSEMPLTKLYLDDMTCQDFQSLVLPRTLKDLRFEVQFGRSENSVDSWPTKFAIESASQLEYIALDLFRASNVATEIRLSNLPRLKRLFLQLDQPSSQSQIGALPSLDELIISPSLWPYFRQHSLSQLKLLSLKYPAAPLEQVDLERALSLPQLKDLTLQVEWPIVSAEKVAVPSMPNLSSLTIDHATIAEEPEQDIPAALLTKIVLQSPALESLSATVDQIDDALIAAIVSRPLIKWLKLEARQCQASLSSLSNCAELRRLELCMPLKNEHLQELNQLQQLTELHLHDFKNETLDFNLLTQRPTLEVHFNFSDLRDFLKNKAKSSAGQKQAN